ncbi:pol-like protein [Colletotrichum kahawae]|uniref:Pol-like protein n=1 Tax=Colletotrichum kahawae TaxID=34407 RepID=A0AAE0CXK7_COLKA|nr:pol-like protein [Colletotrichum kahawae]
MRDKIELDVRYISSNTDIWYFINSCLNSGLQQVVATFYTAGGPGGQKDSMEFLKYLDRTYKDLNTDLRAVTTLRTLRQRDDQSLSSFFPRFERTLAEASGANWADKAKIAFLEGALSTRLKRGLIYVELLKDDYHGWLLKA